ncbi:Nitrogen fixation regulation protein FixK [Hartmannibacter diazotrophicus]|uniref:Nitrogen fixation regulation protein FixK n=1 Tax=Hartmannibacter diazotrophicus TaxID=1482074 RepID=A0A2C9D7R1_9HYPH|nr:Crp/Fnr family transcriptional regulator [Hartmannibacter diazotrophicus]SON56347.1 Nitrogen fixation regulation protein FixK [Hartmannibacter diazotrophicus]
MYDNKGSNKSATKCDTCPVRAEGPCKAACVAGIARLAGGSFVSNYAKGETIVPQGDDCLHVGILVSGVVRVTNTTAEGRHMVVAILEHGSMIGSLTEPRSRFAYEAASPAVVCTMQRQTFVSILKAFPEVSLRVLELMHRQAEEVQEWLTLFNGRTALERLAGYLHALALGRHAEEDGVIVLDVPVGRKDLAAYLGTTPETLSRSFQQLARGDILTVVNGRRVVISNIRKLGWVAGNSGNELLSILHGHGEHREAAGVAPDATLHRAA